MSKAALPAAAAAGLGVALGAWLLRPMEAAAAAGAPYDAALDEVTALVRPNVRRLEPYRCARDDYEEGVLLDANENAFGPALAPDLMASTLQLDPDAPLAAAALKKDLHRYPCPYQRPLKEKIAAYRGVAWSNVFVGVGSDEAIDLLFRVFCEPRAANVVTTPATYGMYKVCAALQDVKVKTAPLLPETFAVDATAVEAAVDEDTRLVFLCSPGNPTATRVPTADVERLVTSPKLKRCIVVVDEAYVDFSAEPTVAPLVLKHPRLVVLHTLSKAFGLAGARVGTAIGSEALVQYLNNVKAPYSINKMTSSIARAAFEPGALELLKKNVAETLAERARVAAALQARPFVCTVFPSDSNFLLVRLKDHAQAKPLYKKMAESGVVIRYRGDQQHLSGCVRVTIGTPSDNDAFLKLLDATAPEFGLV